MVCLKKCLLIKKDITKYYNRFNNPGATLDQIIPPIFYIILYRVWGKINYIENYYPYRSTTEIGTKKNKIFFASVYTVYFGTNKEVTITSAVK